MTSDRQHEQKHRKRQHVKILLTCQKKRKYICILITLFGWDRVKIKEGKEYRVENKIKNENIREDI